MLSDDELAKAYNPGSGSLNWGHIQRLRAVAEAARAEGAKQALEDAADQIYDGWEGGTGIQGLARSEAEDWLRARAASISTDKAGATTDVIQKCGDAFCNQPKHHTGRCDDSPIPYPHWEKTSTRKKAER